MGKTVDVLRTDMATFVDESQELSWFQRIMDWVYKLFTKRERLHYRSERYTKIRNHDGTVLYVHDDIVRKSFDDLIDAMRSRMEAKE